MAAISGVTMSATSALMTAPNAAPITTATARSTRLPRRMKSRNSVTRLLLFCMGVLSGRDGSIIRTASRTITLGPDGPVPLLRRHGGLGAERAAGPARGAAAPRRRRDPVRLRGGDAAPADPQRGAARGLPRVPHALPRRPLARPPGDAEVLRAARPRAPAERAGTARHPPAARGRAVRLRPPEVPLRDRRARGVGRLGHGRLGHHPVPGRA